MMKLVRQKMKKCSKCEVEKPLDNFSANKKTKDGLQYRCKSCLAEYMADYQLNKRYGITLQEYDDLLRSQGGGCAICGSEDSGWDGRFSVDHNHDTGEVRALLCNSCNRGLGFFKDSPDVLQSAKEYLLERGNYGT